VSGHLQTEIMRYRGKAFEDAQKFPFDFLRAFGNKPPTIRRLRSSLSLHSCQGAKKKHNL
jgi:hypothetical protein